VRADKFHQGVPTDHFDAAGRYIFADPEIGRMAEAARAVGATMYIINASAQTPDAPANRIAGDIDVRADLALDSWTSYPNGAVWFAGKWGGGSTRSWQFGMNAAPGKLSLMWTPDGTNGSRIESDSTVAVGVSAGQRLQVRVTLAVSTGTVTFYTRSISLALPLTDNTNWTTLGTPVVTAATSIYAGADAFRIANSGAGNYPVVGSYYDFLFLSDINGTVVMHANFAAQTYGATSFTESSPNAATITLYNTFVGVGCVQFGYATVTFNANGGAGSMSPETASSPTALTTNTFTRAGYAFTGWNTAANGSGTAYADGASYPFTASATLYAQWATNITAALTPSASVAATNAESVALTGNLT
jgi:uncharacterized repeat protein (TIGR02543 family)